MSAAVLGGLPGERLESGYSGSFALSFAIHAVLLTVIFFGVRWQSSPPQTVTVELWEPPQPVVAPKPPPPKVEPEPPKPEPKIEKPEIVEKPAPKPKPEVKPKPVPPKKADDREFQRQMREQLALEQAAAQERQLKELVTSRALAAWTDKIRAKIRGNILLPPDLVGNPEALYEVTLLPTGEVLGQPKLIKSSGHKGYDDAIERAILKSSPLPKPDPASLFQRRLELRFRPLDK